MNTNCSGTYTADNSGKDTAWIPCFFPGVFVFWLFYFVQLFTLLPTSSAHKNPRSIVLSGRRAFLSAGNMYNFCTVVVIGCIFNYSKKAILFFNLCKKRRFPSNIRIICSLFPYQKSSKNPYMFFEGHVLEN